MWIEGQQPPFNPKNVNEEILKLKGHLSEKESRYWLAQYLKSNVGVATRIISGVELFPFQEVAIKTMMQKDYFLGIWCLDENGLVYTDKGIKKIRDVQVGDYVFSKNKKNIISDKWENPKEAGKEVCTKRHYKLKGKNGHKCLVLDEKSYSLVYKNIEDIKIGDHLAIRFGSDLWGDNNPLEQLKFEKSSSKPWTEKECTPKHEKDFYFMLGYFIGDGWFNTKQDVFSITSQEDNIINIFINKIKEYAPDNILSIKQKENYIKEIYFVSKMFCKTLLDLGFDDTKKAYQKNIPDSLLSLSKVNLCALLCGLFSANGFCSIIKDKKHKNVINYKLGLKSTSYELLHQVRIILLNIGIVTNLHETTENNKNIRKSWNLTISGYENVKLFNQNISFLCKHKFQDLNKLEYYLKEKNKNCQTLILPNLGKYLKSHGYDKKDLGFHSDNISYHSVKKSNLPILKKISSEFQNIELVPVIKIDDIETKTIDITVEDEECYIGDGFINHNSRGLSKCMNQNNLCFSKQRGLIRAKDVIIGEEILSKNNYNKVLDKTVNPIDTTYKIITKKGYESEGLDYHKVLVLTKDLKQEWKYSKELKSGDILVMRKGGLFPQQKNIFTNIKQDAGIQNKRVIIKLKQEDLNDWYYFFGLLIGDGCISDKFVSITSENKETKQFLKLFAKKINVNYREANESGKAIAIIFSSTNLVSILKQLGFVNKRNKKIIPYEILEADKKNIGLLLKGLFDTDGYCSIQEKEIKNSISITVGFTNTSEELILQIRNLLLNFGIVSKKSITFNGGLQKFKQKFYQCKKAWSILITSHENVNLYKNNIGFNIKYKSNALNKIENYKYKNAEFSCYIPFVGEYLEKKYKSKSFCQKGEKLNFRKFTSKNLLTKIINSGRLKEQDKFLLESLNEDHLFFDEVTKVKKDRAITIDLTVENEHCYVSDGIINHNSFSTAIFAFLHAIYSHMENPLGAKIAIISRSFRQSREIFKKIEEIASQPEGQLLVQCFTGSPRHSNDEWSMKIGNSEIKALPLGDGEKLRGFRFNCLIIDELLLMPEKVVNEVIMPFLAVNSDPMKRQKTFDQETLLIKNKAIVFDPILGKERLFTEEDRTKFPNPKMIGLSSASYKFEHLYKTYTDYLGKIETGTDDGKPLREDKSNKLKGSYAVMQLAYDVAPSELYSASLLEKSKTEMSKSQFAREFGAEFTDDSSGYFSLSAMDQCTIEYGSKPATEIKGDPNAKYILAIDPSSSEDESSDFFAMILLKQIEEKKWIQVHSYAVAGGKIKDHIRYFYYLLTNFNIVYISMDNAGGVTFLSAANESKLFNENKLELKVINKPNFMNENDYQKELKEAAKEYNLSEKKIVYMQVFNSDWIRYANEHLQANIDHKRIMWAADAQGNSDEHSRQMKQQIEIKDLKFVGDESKLGDDYNDKRVTNNVKQLEFIEHQSFLIDLTKRQCALIETKTSDTGKLTFTLPSNLKNQKGPNRARRDLYSALLIGNYAVRCYEDFSKVTIKKETGFKPFFVT